MDATHGSPARRMMRALPALAALLTAAACIAPGDGGADGGPGESAAPDNSGGGPKGDPGVEVGEVKTEAVAPDTIELATRTEAADGGEGHEHGEGGEEMIPPPAEEWDPAFTITFTRAVREEDALVVDGEAAYLRESGSFVLHSSDLAALPGSGEGDGMPAADDGVLAEAPAGGEPAAFTARFPDAPRAEEGGPLPLLKYTTPDEVWGHPTADDWVPGRVCYQEGDTWHEIPLFEYTDVPCG